MTLSGKCTLLLLVTASIATCNVYFEMPFDSIINRSLILEVNVILGTPYLQVQSIDIMEGNWRIDFNVKVSDILHAVNGIEIELKIFIVKH